MDSKKEKQLKKTFDDYIDLMLYDFPVERMGDLIADDVSGYGTTVDEKFLEIKRFKKVVTDQREQGAGIEMHFRITPIHRRVSPDEDTAIFMDEFEITMVIDGAKNVLLLRLTSVFEFLENNWKLVHIHGSKAVDTEGDTWHLNEWKKKNEELQKQVEEKTADLWIKNRELEIETALEKVRSNALAMKRPEDMVEVCRIISDQLQLLGVKDIRNVQTVIINEQKGSYLNYQYFTAYTKGVIEDTDYNRHPTVLEMVQQLRKSKDAFFTGLFEGEELKTFRDWRKQNNQFSDPLLDKAKTVHYYFYSIGEGGLGLSTYGPINDAELEIFKRFHSVFVLAYRRFVDIELAEAQARESRIEAALEKIRSRALAMRYSSEVGNVSTLLFSELEKMDINPSGFSIMIFDEEHDKYELWRAKEVAHQGTYETFSIKAMFDKLDQYVPGFSEELKSAWTKGNPFFVGEFRGKRRVSFLQANREMANYSDDAFTALKKKFPDPTFWHLVFFKHGWFGVLQNDQLPEKDLLLIHRFAEVFDFAFTRFLDIKNAEAQAREAQIEAALERVRSRTMGMQHSDELQEAAVLLFQQVVALGVPAFGSGFNIWDDDRKCATAWMGGQDRMQPPFKTSSSEDIFLRIYEAAQKEESLFVEEQGGEALKTHYKYLNSIPVFKEIADKMAVAGQSFPTFQIMHCAFFSQGYLMFITFESVPDAYDIFKRFAKVFEQTYTRFLDLQKAEAQAKESQLELSLERIRAQVTSMQESSDLLDIVVTMRTEFVKLGHEAHYFWHMRWLPEKYEKAMTSGDGTRIGMVMTLPRHIHGDIKLVADWEKSDKSSVVLAMDVETAVVYVDKMITLGDFEIVDHNAPTLDDLRHIGGLTFVMARTTHGEIGYSLPGVVPKPPSEDIATLVRFAGVFDLAYKRFEDLKSTERQHREAKIELALERTRTQSMLMQHSHELNEISKTFHEQLLWLGIDSEFSFVWLPDEEKQEHMFWATWMSEVNGISQYHSKAINYPLDKTEPGTAACYVAWESGQPVHETFVSPGEVLAFFAAWEELLRGADQFKPEFFPDGIYYTEAYMKYGCFGIDIQRQLTNDEKEILRRFSVEFERTYTRFLDLKKAEAQALRAEEDLIAIKVARQKAEEALSELKATQSQLIHAEKMASLGELTAGIAHEIQNPLNFVNNFSEVSSELMDEMKEELAVGTKASVQLANEIADDIKQNLEKINHHGKRAADIVKGMLQHSRTSSGTKELTDINALADEYLRLAYHGLRAKDKSFNAEFKMEADENLPKVNVLGQDIGRVLLNLINNAFYAVSARSSQNEDGYKPLVLVSTKNLNDKIEIRVRDNGNGVPVEIKDKIFQPFFTTKPTGQGTGLGLSMSYDIITKGHGGELNVNSHENEGAEFMIRLPVS